MLFAEMVWDKTTGQLIGDLNQTVFDNEKKLVSHVFVFIVKSVKNHKFHYFFTKFTYKLVQRNY